ncbi:MAG TPA: ATP-dependent DNA ligase [Alphaproteobacteria bacterium]|nr:ATP-dependent DNA ligase [Alphaproteobacteria bacterium]
MRDPAPFPARFDLTSTEAPFAPMEAQSVSKLPQDEGWQFEPKWDGFRCLAVKAGSIVHLFAKSGKPLGRYFPDVLAAVAEIAASEFVLDGELVIPVGETLSFDALQLRLHPAESRVRKLAAETPAALVAFDLPVAPGNRPLLDRPLPERRAALEKLLAQPPDGIALSPFTRDRGRALHWLDGVGAALDGVVAKRLEAPYQPGERAMLKVKRIRTADCVVGGFRYGTNSKEVGSLLLGLYDDDGRLDHVGFTSGIPAGERKQLTKRLETLAGGSGFTGRAPGGPSRWSTERTGEYVALRHELVVEVEFDQVTGNRFRHGTRFLRWRPDKAPAQCTFAQLAPEIPPREVLKAVLGN